MTTEVTASVGEPVQPERPTIYLRIAPFHENWVLNYSLSAFDDVGPPGSFLVTIPGSKSSGTLTGSPTASGARKPCPKCGSQLDLHDWSCGVSDMAQGERRVDVPWIQGEPVGEMAPPAPTPECDAVRHGIGYSKCPACINTPDLRGALEECVKALDRIARPPDCGCRPCRGQCRSQQALEIELDEIREEARSALTRARRELGAKP